MDLLLRCYQSDQPDPAGLADLLGRWIQSRLPDLADRLGLVHLVILVGPSGLNHLADRGDRLGPDPLVDLADQEHHGGY